MTVQKQFLSAYFLVFTTFSAHATVHSETQLIDEHPGTAGAVLVEIPLATSESKELPHSFERCGFAWFESDRLVLQATRVAFTGDVHASNLKLTKANSLKSAQQ